MLGTVLLILSSFYFEYAERVPAITNFVCERNVCTLIGLASYACSSGKQTKPVACQDFETNSIFVVSMFMFQYYISKITFEKGKIAKVI